MVRRKLATWTYVLPAMLFGFCFLLFSWVVFAAEGDITLTIKTAVVYNKESKYYQAPVIQLTDSEGQVIVLKTVKSEINENDFKNGACGIYEGNVSAGIYYYTAKDPTDGTSLGRGSFIVEAEKTTQEIFLSIFDFKNHPLNPNITVINNGDNIPFTIKITGPDGKTDFPVGDNRTAILPAGEGEDDYPYSYAFIPENDSYWGSSGELWVYARNAVDNFTPLNKSDERDGFLIAPKTTIRIEAEKGAEVKVTHIVRLYRPLEYIEGKQVLSANGKTTWEFVVPLRKDTQTHLNYEVRKNGKMTQGGCFSVSDYADCKQVLSLPKMRDDYQAVIRDKSQGYHEASILLNGPDSKMVSLNQGDSFDIWASRVWQAVEGEASNTYMDPDFHYILAEGDSVRIRETGG